MINLAGYLFIFSVSLGTLLLEFLQLRIFSFQYWYHLVYFIVTTALLGLAAGGAALALFQKLRVMAENKFYAFCLAGFAASASLGTFIISFLRSDFFSFWQNTVNIFFLVAAYTLAALPYIFFGLALARVWSEQPRQAAKVYFVNLLGSILGILIFIFFLQPLGAQRLLQILVVVFWLLALFFIKNEVLKLPGKKIFLLSCLFCLSLMSVFLLVIKPDKNKLFWTWFDHQGKVIFSQWNPVARVDVIEDPATGQLAVLSDGDAQTTPLDLGNGHRNTAYLARVSDQPLGNVLVIGSGAGADVLLAFRYGSKNIDAVEINPTTIRLVKNELSQTVGDIFSQEGVRLFEQDGRSFIKKTAKKYDVIVLMAVDNFAVSNAGAYLMAENYPYTLEAFGDYWDHLDDDGLIQVSRFYYPQAPRETLRVFTTFFEALANKGVAEPEKHIIVFVSAEGIVSPFGSVIVSKKPIDDLALAQIEERLKKGNPVLGFLFPKLSPFVGQPGHVVFKAFVESWKKDKGVSFYKNYLFNVRPATDDKPFFYQYGKLANILWPINVPNDEKYFNDIRGQWPFLIIFTLLIQSILIVGGLIWLTLKKLRAQAGPDGSWFYPLAYFSAVGLGFMFLEITLIQKMALFLGHPTYSLAVVIPALLTGVGLGSLASAKLGPKQQKTMTLPLVFIILGLTILLSGGGLDFLLGWGTGSVIATIFASLAGLGFFAGIHFPSGLVRLADKNYLIPLAWAANGGFSVIGSIAAIILAMLFGFNLVMVLSSGFYLLAFILLTVWDKKLT